MKIADEVLKLSIKSGVATVKKAGPNELPQLCLTEGEAAELFFGIEGLMMGNDDIKSFSALPFLIDAPDTF